MGKRRDPNYTTGHLCRFCGQLVPWGTILRVIRTDKDTPAFMLSESACHTECLKKHLRPGVELTFPRHWNGKLPYLDDDEDIFSPSPLEGEGWGEGLRTPHHCAMCGKAIAANDLVRLRIQKPAGPVKRPEFDEQSLPVHAACLAAVSTMKLG
jgi:hypothetical protein